MIVNSLHIAGFGRLSGRHFEFSTGLNVVYGPNESGKSTVANAIVATLYGAERKKEIWRPWSGGPFATRLIYQLASGEHIEIQRDFDRDAKGLHVYDRAGNEISGQLPGHKVIPGEAHLGVPLEVFLNAACVKQQAIAIDEGKQTGPIAAHLARALDGGPREDAALGAIGRLDEALRTHVGSERARKNAPLRALRARADEQRAKVDDGRARLAALDELRARMERAGHTRDRLSLVASGVERRARALRAGALAKRLAKLHEFRAELAELQADHAAYADVADVPADRQGEMDEAFYAWEAAHGAAVEAAADAASAVLGAAERRELQQLRNAIGSIDDSAFATLTSARERAETARALAASTSRDAAAVRADDDSEFVRNPLLAGGIVALCIAIGFAIAHSWMWTGVCGLVACIGLGAALVKHREGAQRERVAEHKQRIADEALAAETVAASAVTTLLAPLGIDRFEELVALRVRYADLVAREQHAERCAERARVAQLAAQTAGERFDSIAAAIAPAPGADRAAHKAAATARAARRRERDGIDAHLHALEMRKSTILGSDDEYALECELAEMQRDGVEPTDDDAPGALRTIENERSSIAEQVRAAGEVLARLRGEIDALAAQVPDLAALDEELARIEREIERLERFERAVTLAKSTLESRTLEAHQAFARRLEDYAATTLGAITAGRYAEIFVDPTTLAIKVRIPETRAITELDAVSAGTRDQTYLVVRFAMSRMFAEGFETPPLLLDDPFAYWDAVRIERCLPIIEHQARGAQAILFTSSRELAEAAAKRGAHRVDLPEPVAVFA